MIHSVMNTEPYLWESYTNLTTLPFPCFLGLEDSTMTGPIGPISKFWKKSVIFFWFFCFFLVAFVLKVQFLFFSLKLKSFQGSFPLVQNGFSLYKTIKIRTRQMYCAQNFFLCLIWEVHLSPNIHFYNNKFIKHHQRLVPFTGGTWTSK
jgi:magnesium-transporting ATPase (P-type)